MQIRDPCVADVADPRLVARTGADIAVTVDLHPLDAGTGEEVVADPVYKTVLLLIDTTHLVADHRLLRLRQRKVVIEIHLRTPASRDEEGEDDPEVAVAAVAQGLTDLMHVAACDHHVEAESSRPLIADCIEAFLDQEFDRLIALPEVLACRVTDDPVLVVSIEQAVALGSYGYVAGGKPSHQPTILQLRRGVREDNRLHPTHSAVFDDLDEVAIEGRLSFAEEIDPACTHVCNLVDDRDLLFESQVADQLVGEAVVAVVTTGRRHYPAVNNRQTIGTTELLFRHIPATQHGTDAQRHLTETVVRFLTESQGMTPFSVFTTQERYIIFSIFCQ